MHQPWQVLRQQAKNLVVPHSTPTFTQQSGNKGNRWVKQSAHGVWGNRSKETNVDSMKLCHASWPALSLRVDIWCLPYCQLCQNFVCTSTYWLCCCCCPWCCCCRCNCCFGTKSLALQETPWVLRKSLLRCNCQVSRCNDVCCTVAWPQPDISRREICSSAKTSQMLCIKK